MAFKNLFFLFALLLALHSHSCRADSTNQSRFFDLMKKSTSGDSLSTWEANTTYCDFTGIACDDQRDIIGVDISGWSLTGKFPDEICAYLPKLRSLRLSRNSFVGMFPTGITNCSFLEELNVSRVYYTGPLPDFSPLKKTLRILDLSYNHFSGDFPASITNLTGLIKLSLNENTKLNLWQLPDNISRLLELRSMILTTCMVRGRIPASLGNMTSLVDLELSGNYLTGRVPTTLGQLKNLRQLELYYNQLDGEIPSELGNLTQLHDLDMSVNRFVGKIPESICRLPNIRVLQLYNNSLVGEIPRVIANSTTLITLSLYSNFLTGQVPFNLGRSSPMVGLDLSENQFSGRLPEGLCSGGKLKYLLVLQNFFSGEIPESYGECKSIIRFRVSSNNLGGKIPRGIFSLPRASIIDVEKNDFTGSIPGDIRTASSLSELFMQGNRISGVIPPDISFATNLVKIDLSNNFLSGPIPSEIGNLRWLNLLLLQNNELSSSIPESLSLLKSLNDLDLSSNRLTGKVPESLGKLLPNSLNFSNNHLTGEIPFPFVKGGVLESFADNPGLCVPSYYRNTSSSGPNFSFCPLAYDKKKLDLVWVIGISIGILIIGTILFLKRWFSRNRKVTGNEDAVSSSYFSYDVKSFHRLSFDQREIIDALVDKNIVGYGGSGTVYKIELNNGEIVAVKSMWGRNTKDSNSDGQPVLDRELKTEVETLGSIRHKNIVKLYCYFSSIDCNLLVYEYMPNGNLWDALHKGKILLDWPIRHQVALGVAQGLAYLHHDLVLPIIHRDIKSTNILLDVDYLPKVADFGIAKVLQARGSKDSTTTAIAGTYGYLAPEYAYSSKATTRCDVYSFGVVLMELLTGKKPVEPEFGENKNIIYWVSTKVETKEGAMDVLDQRVLGLYKDDMIKVLRIAIRCTCRTPNLRPTMNEVVQLLIEADPCKFDCCKFPDKIEESKDPTKIKEKFNL